MYLHDSSIPIYSPVHFLDYNQKTSIVVDQLQIPIWIVGQNSTLYNET